MLIGNWTRAELNELTLIELLEAIEDMWGVRLAVGVLRLEDGLGGHELQAFADLPATVHAAELCYPPVVMVPLLSTRKVDLERQLVYCAAGWVDVMKNNMAVNACPR